MNLQEASEQLYTTQIMELNKRRELDTAQAMLAEKMREVERLSNLQSSPNSSESS